MKKFNINYVLLFFTVIALICILFRQFILIDVPEWFSWGSELGELLFNLSIGYLVTYWFYYLTVQRPGRIRRNKATLHSKVYVNKILLAYESLSTELLAANKDVVEFDKGSKEELEAAFKLINLRSNSTIYDSNFNLLTWGSLIRSKRNQIVNNLREITLLFNDLDVEQVEAVTILLRQNIFEYLKNIDLNHFDSFEGFASDYYELGSLMDNLKRQFEVNN